MQERIKELAREAGGVPMRENCLDAEAFPWGVEMEIDALERFAQAVARDIIAACHERDLWCMDDPAPHVDTFDTSQERVEKVSEIRLICASQRSETMLTVAIKPCVSRPRKGEAVAGRRDGQFAPSAAAEHRLNRPAA